MTSALHWLTGFLPCRLINDGDRPYLERYYVASVFGVRFYLHRFVDSDPGRGLHDHPWNWAVSLILAGAYREQRMAGFSAEERLRVVERVVSAGSLNLIKGDSFHRVNLDTGRAAWSLFIHGPYAKGWGFLHSSVLFHGEAMSEARVVYEKAARVTHTSQGAPWWRDAPKGRDAGRLPL